METDLQKQLDSHLVRIMVRNNISSPFFDDKDLQEIVKLAFQDQKIFGRFHFTQNVIPIMAVFQLSM
uniref:Uncharacterized protein n=1 Tax=Meloidogyne enterolobii TaxID=390850 RepID=A0A6V7WUQ7_MELEN|nr:unnamed protein product [Meloidogyne enterolobii]